jgi:hypothetical protein
MIVQNGRNRTCPFGRFLCTYISTCPGLEARLIFLSRECIVHIYKVSCFIHITLSSLPVLLTLSAVFLDSFCLQKARVLDEACMHAIQGEICPPTRVESKGNLPPRVCRSGSIQLNTLVGSGLFLLPAVFLKERLLFTEIQPASQPVHTVLLMHGCMRARASQERSS